MSRRINVLSDGISDDGSTTTTLNSCGTASTIVFFSTIAISNEGHLFPDPIHEQATTGIGRVKNTAKSIRGPYMSKAHNPSGFHVAETAPPSLLRVERRPSFGRTRLETIQEEAEGHGQIAKASKPALPFGFYKADFPAKASQPFNGCSVKTCSMFKK
ncbi:hypothetical protein SAY86_005697 [Trapa natans]|uniref:Uncharacterized protein n=1 Tax=Trapa natans TaxID=22666 RepID=A0AAN7L3D4_TRANT|nr:hypothetical protein SAY86_005697 [Trapa natans]